MIKYIIAFTLLIGTLDGFGQTCELNFSGKAIDSHENIPLEGAIVFMPSIDKSAYTNLDGEFAFTDLCAGTYTVQIEHPQCKTQIFEIVIRKDLDRSFYLEHHLEQLNEVIISGKSFRTKSETQLTNTIDLNQIEQFSSESLGDVLNTLSGVSSLNTGNSVVKPVINGLHSSRISIINNGVLMQDQEWGAEHAPNIDVNTAGFISVLKGASTLQFSGDAVGGMIISEPKRVVLKDTLYGKTIVSASSNGRGGSISTELLKGYQNGWYGVLQGTAKRFGDFEAPDYVLSNTGLQETDFTIRVGKNQFRSGFEAYASFFKSKIGILRASHLGGAADQVAAITSEQPLIIRDFTYDILEPRQEVTHLTGRLSYFKKFEGLGKLDVQYDVQYNERFEFDIRRGDNANRASVDLTLTTHRFNAGLESEISDNLTLKSGFMLGYQENVADPSTGVRRLIPDYEEYTVAAYGIADYQASERLLLEAGIRFDYVFMDVFKFYRSSFWELRGYQEEFGDLVVEEFGNQLLVNPELTFNNVSATAGLNYKLGKTSRLYFNYALATRNPNPSELFSEGLHHSASRIELGDLRFDSEVSNRLSLTLDTAGKDWSLQISPFANWIDNFLLIEPTGVQQTVRGNFQVWEYRQTPAFLAGLDLDFNWQFSERFSTTAQFSMVKGYDEQTDTPLINMPPVNFTNGIRYKLPSWYQFETGIKSEYVFEQNEFPNTNFDVFLPEQEATVEVDVSTPPPAYHLLHWDAQASFGFVGKSTLQLGIQVSNLLNTEYRNYLNRLRYYADDLGRNFRFQLKINY